MNKGQASLEYILIIGAILVVTLPLFYYVSQSSSQNLKNNQAFDAVNTLAKKADSVYALGPGTRDYVWIAIPGGVTSTSVGNKTISIYLSGSRGDVSVSTKANVTGYFPPNAGTYRMVVQMLDTKVFIGLFNDTTPPQVISTSPTGVIKINNPLLSATTNEAARCKYDLTDTSYSSMANPFTGIGLSHTQQLTNQAAGNYLYYVRCIDFSNNTMTSSALINFSINLDAQAPAVNKTGVTLQKLFVGTTTCVNATVTDNVGIANVWAMLSSPVDAPYSPTQNYTLTDAGSSCGGGANDTWYGADIQMQIVGTNYINTTFANDTAGNLGFQNPYPNIRINYPGS